VRVQQPSFCSTCSTSNAASFSGNSSASVAASVSRTFRFSTSSASAINSAYDGQWSCQGSLKHACNDITKFT
jgi:hypothetical protein